MATAALNIVVLLPTPQLRTAAVLALLRNEVHQRSGKEHLVTDTTVTVPTSELFNLDALISVDSVMWWCRLCDHHSTARHRPAASTDAVAHLVAEHRATISTT
jgi:hypothetical protein